MLKKSIFAAAGVFLLSALFFGRDAVSYVGTSIGWFKDSIKASVPVEFEIERARKMVRDLVPDIRRNMHVIAKEEVEVERLESQIAEAEKNLDSEKGKINRLTADLSSANGRFVYVGRSYSAEKVKTDLANKFARYKTKDATLASLRDIHSARIRGLEAARQKLDDMMVAKRKLKVDLEHLEARLKMVEAAQTASDYSFDDSNLGRAKELVSDLRTRLDVAERMVSAEGDFQGEIPMEEPAPDDILEQVAEYFGRDVDGSQVVRLETAATR